MKMKFKILLTPIFIGIFFLSGCVSATHTRVEEFDLEKLSQKPTEKLFDWFHAAHRDKKKFESTTAFERELNNDFYMILLSDKAFEQLEQEIDSRTDLTEEEREAAKEQKIFIGMSEHALICSLGQPRSSNRTVTVSGTSVQYVYGSFGPYVYTTNGYITSWQD